MRRFTVVFGGVLFLACATSASAGPIVTYDFTGTVSSVGDNKDFMLNGTIPIGTSVAGSFTYDAGVAGTPSPFDPTVTVYEGAALSFSVNIGGGLLVWTSGPLNFFGLQAFVFDNNPSVGDEFELRGGESPPTGLILPAGATTSVPFGLIGDFFLTDPTNAALADQSLPTSLDLSAFPFRSFQLEGGQPGGTIAIHFPGDIETTVDSLTLRTSAAVPEPSTLVIMSVGLLVLSLARWAQIVCRGKRLMEREAGSLRTVAD